MGSIPIGRTFWKVGRVAECTGLENQQSLEERGSWVQIPHLPQQNKTQA